VGNKFYNAKLFFQTTFKVLLFDRLKYRQGAMMKQYEEKKYYIPGFYYITTLLMAFISSAVTLIFTYPFDNAYTRAAANLSYEKRYLKLQDCFMGNPEQSIMTRYYSGLTFGVIQTLVHSTITLAGFQLLQSGLFKNDKDNISYINVFGGTSAISLLASVASYPFDTVKRRYQILTAVDTNIPLMNVPKGNYYR
jgi:hypothetical protein